MPPDASERRHAEAWNAVAAAWRQGRGGSLWRAHSDAVYTALLERWLPRGPLDAVLKTDLFDEAVSEGLYPVLASRARLVAGIDLASVTAVEARARHRTILAAGADVRALPFADRTFDAVVSLSTLDHFESLADLEAGLAELGRVLRPGGTLVLTLDNLANPLIRLRNLLPFGVVHALGLVPYFVGRSLTPRGAEALLGRHAFSVRESTAVLHVPRVAAVPAASLAERWLRPPARARLLDGLMRWERLERLPSRRLTGHYVALCAAKGRS